MELQKVDLKRGAPRKYVYETLGLNETFPVTKPMRGTIKTAANKWGRQQEPVREFDIYTDGVKFYLKRIV